MTYASAPTLLSVSHGRHLVFAYDVTSNFHKCLSCVLVQISNMDSMDDAGVRCQEALEQSGLLSAMRFGGSTRAARPCS